MVPCAPHEGAQLGEASHASREADDAPWELESGELREVADGVGYRAAGAVGARPPAAATLHLQLLDPLKDLVPIGPIGELNTVGAEDLDVQGPSAALQLLQSRAASNMQKV